MNYAKILAFLLFMQMFCVIPLANANASSPNSSITANVVVGCPFTIDIRNQSPAIPKFGNFIVNYSLNPTVDCSVGKMNGTLTLYLNNKTVKEFGVTVGQFNSISNNNQSINASTLSIGNYTLKLEFANKQTSNSTYSHFEVLEPANLSLVNFSIPSPVGIGSYLNMYFRILNSGNYSANNITLYVNVRGIRVGISQQISNISASPASENVTLETSNFTLHPGTYLASAYLEYKKSLTSNEIYKTNTLNVTYVVKAPNHPTPTVTIPPTPIPKVPKVVITSTLLYLTSTPNTTMATSIGISNPSNSIETLNFSLPAYLSNIIKLSTYSIELNPGANVSVSLLVDSRNISSGVYNIPINVTATIGNRTTSYVDYITYSVSSREPDKPLINTAVEIVNNTNDGYIVISISTPNNVTITNGTAITYLPQGLVPNSTYMDAYGIPNNITEQDGYYYIEWHISRLAPSQNIYAYVYVRHPESQLLLSGIKTDIFTTTSTVTSILHLLYVGSPTFETYWNGTTEVELLYTGAYPENVTFTLTGPNYMHIYNASQVITAVPNQLLYVYFKQGAGGTAGTAMENLHVSAPNAALNYTVPLLVIQSPVVTTVSTTVAPSTLQLIVASVSKTVKRYLAFIIVVIIAIILALAYYSYKNRSRYNHGRITAINKVKEQIKRNINEKK